MIACEIVFFSNKLLKFRSGTIEKESAGEIFLETMTVIKLTETITEAVENLSS